MLGSLIPALFTGLWALIGRAAWWALTWATTAAMAAGPVGLAARAVIWGLRGASVLVPQVFRRHWRQPDEWTAFSTDRPRTYYNRAITGRLLLLGDNQLQHAFGEPDASSNLADRWSEPSSRPALCSLFGELLLDEALTRGLPRAGAAGEAPRLPVVHMGDATNTSCLSEWRRFEQTLLAAAGDGRIGPARPFVMLPGNHDGFLYGNFAAHPLSMLSGDGRLHRLLRPLLARPWRAWTCRCADPLSEEPGQTGPMTKADFVERYLALLPRLYGGGRPEAEAEAERAAIARRLGGPAHAWRLYRPPEGADGFLEVALAYVDRRVPARSFVVQVVRWPAPPPIQDARSRSTRPGPLWRERLAAAPAGTAPPPVRGLLLDTCDYPSRFVMAGTHGGLGTLQLRAAELALDAAVGAAPTGPSLLTLFGHHNLGALLGTARWRLGGLMHRLARDGRFRVLPLFVSAHRHKGGWLQSLLPIAPLALRRIRCMDLNVSSLVDWPLATRDVALSGSPEGWHDHHLVVVSSQRPVVAEALFRDPALFPDPPGATDADLAGARAIGRGDTLAQRRNPRRLMPLRRLGGLLRDPAGDALAAEVALLGAAAGTLQRLLREAAAMLAAPVPGLNATRDALRAALNDAAAEAASGARPSRATFESLRLAVHRGTALVRTLAGTAPAPTPFRAVLRAAIVAAAREDMHRQWMAQPHLVPAIGDRWFRRAANIDERYGVLRTYDPCDPDGHRRHSTRLRGYRHRSRVASLAALALALAAAVVPDARAGTVEIRAARFEGGAAAAGGPVEVALPHLWPRAAATDAPVRTGAYRIALPPFPPGEPLWVYVPKLRTNASFELNGHWVADGGRMQPPIARHANSPFFVALPPGLAREGGNELVIRVVAPADSRGGLSVIQVGPWDALEGTVALRRLAQNAGVYATSAVLAATSIYILLIWWHGERPRSRAYPLLGAAGLVWAARNLNLVLLDFGTTSDRGHRLIEYSAFVGHGVFLALFGLFLLDRYAGIVPPRLVRAMRWAIAGFLLLGPVLVWTLGGPAPALTVWLVAGAPLLAAMAWILARQARRSRATADRLLAALFVAFIAASVYDNAVLAVPSLFGRIYVAHYVGLAFFATIAVLLAQQYSDALRAYASLNQSLESRLSEREREIELRFRESRVAERERAALEERARIMRDLHDGVGAQLLAAIHEIGEHDGGAAGIREALLACLDDLRLAVDSLEPHENYLTTILGSLRYRMTPRLAAAGIQVGWDVEEIGPLSWLDPSRTLHLLRILQEAIANVLKHAGARHIAVRLARGRDGIEVEVRDDGRGFDPNAVSGGHGLRNLRHRATLLGARLSIESGAGGSRVRVVLPA